MENYFSAFLGSITLILLWLKIQKEKKDDKKTKESWHSYLLKEWDDFALAICSGFVLAYYQEEIFFLIIKLNDYDLKKYIDIYYDAEILISGMLGFFGTFLLKTIYEIGMVAIVKLSDKFKKLLD